MFKEVSQIKQATKKAEKFNPMEERKKRYGVVCITSRIRRLLLKDSDFSDPV